MKLIGINDYTTTRQQDNNKNNYILYRLSKHSLKIEVKNNFLEDQDFFFEWELVWQHTQMSKTSNPLTL